MHACTSTMFVERKAESKIMLQSSSMSSHGKDKEDGTDGSGIISYDELPLDLTVAIFWRLPAKYVVRLRCMSKLWSSIIDTPEFLNHPSNRPHLLVSIRKGNELIVTALSQHQNPSTESFERYHMTLQADAGYTICSGTRGLFCFIVSGPRFGVWNPSMRQFVVLRPQSGIRLLPRALLGYDPVMDKYKLLCISTCRYKMENEAAEVLTLGDHEETWRVAKGCPFHGLVASGPCINGVVYYEANISRHGVDHTNTHLDKAIIMRFDVRFEKFKVMDIPQHHESAGDVHLFNYEEKLAWVCWSLPSMNLWILEDYEKQEWSYRKLILPFFSDLRLTFRGIVDATGELIFIAGRQYRFKNAFCIWFCDPKRNTVREFKFEGTAFEEFTQGSDDKTTISFFPNHIKNFMSLMGVPHSLDLLHYESEISLWLRSLKIVP